MKKNVLLNKIRSNCFKMTECFKMVEFKWPLNLYSEQLHTG